MTALLDHLWQSSLFALAVGLLTLAFQNNAARIRFWLWFAASLKFLLPFALLAMLGEKLAHDFLQQPDVRAALKKIQAEAAPFLAPSVPVAK